MKRLISVLQIGMATALLSRTQDCSAGDAQSAAPARLALKAGKLLNVRSGQFITNAVIVVEAERIASVGPTVPPGMRVIDCSGLTVLPGLVDCHAHPLGNPKDESPTSDLR